MASGDVSHVGRDGLMSKLEELNIKTTTTEHPEVFTVEEMMPHIEHLPGVKCKNLFLRDKKKTKLWLLSARYNASVSMNDLAKRLESPKGVRLADESALFDKLGVKQGCVSPFALLNDTNVEVKFLLDDDLINGGHEKLFFHPMENSASTAISPEDLVKFAEATGHPVTTLSFDAAS